MVIEFCDGGDFFTYLRRNKRLSEDRAKYFMQQLGLLYHTYFNCVRVVGASFL